MLPLFRCHLRPINHLCRDPTHSRTMHTKTALRNPVLQLIKKRNLSIVIINMDLHSLRRNFRMPREFRGERVVMRREEAGAANVCCDVVEDCLCHCYAVVGGGASS